MAKMDFNSVDDYIAAQAEAAQASLERVRGAIRKALPGAEEVISYNIPTYKLHGNVIIYFAGWKKHYSLYPAGQRLVQAFKEELASYEVKNSTIHFPLLQSVPVRLIERIAKFRLKESVARSQEAAQRAKPKARATKKR